MTEQPLLQLLFYCFKGRKGYLKETSVLMKLPNPPTKPDIFCLIGELESKNKNKKQQQQQTNNKNKKQILR